MLGRSNTRLNQLEAANRVLRAELLAQTERAEALSGIVKTLQRENEALARQCTNMATTTQAATQQAQAARGYVIGEDVLARLCWN